MILVLTNADTEVLALRTVVEGLPEGFCQVRAANPAGLVAAVDLDSFRAVIVRLLGGRRAWEPFDRLARDCRAKGIPLIALGGEAGPDEEMAELSTVPAAVWLQAFEYLVEGGLSNIENLLRFVSDTLLSTSFGYEPPIQVPACGVFRGAPTDPSRPTIGIVFYRAHLVSGNTQFVADLCDAIEARGANALAVYCYSLRRQPPEGGLPEGKAAVPAIALLSDNRVDAVITTVLAAGSVTSGGDEWDASAFGALDVPVIQAIASTSSSDEWAANQGGLSPLDVAMSVALPELDGRAITVPFSFKETVDDGDQVGSAISAYRTLPDRVHRVAGTAVRFGRLRQKPPEARKVALVLSAYPTRRSRLGNAVGLDTPASVIVLLRALAGAGYRLDRIPDDGDELMTELAEGFSYDADHLSAVQIGGAAGKLSSRDYIRLFDELPEGLRSHMIDAWGPPPGSVHVTSGTAAGPELVFAGIDLGGVLVAIQPPRGFGEDPIAIYHSPDLVPTHHYLGFYRWLDEVWGADAVVHVGKHGTLEWLPGKGVGLSSSCAPDGVLGDLPLVYPFVVNDPGEGTQAKRRAHAVIIDHLIPPLTRAETYGDLARLESLLDTYAQVAALDPEKLPALRRQVWDLLVEAEIHRDLGISDRSSRDSPVLDSPVLDSPVLDSPVLDSQGFDDLVVALDSYLCELKDSQIRGGLHVLGTVPDGEALIDMVLALTRLPQGRIPSLRETVAGELGVDLGSAGRFGIDRVEAECRARVAQLRRQGWRYRGEDTTLAWVCSHLVPVLRRTTEEVSAVLSAMDGRYVVSGPSGAPSRGMANVLPTGRNFYSVDPRAVPSRLAWDVGVALADGLVDRHLAEEGRYPQSVGLVVWGTSAMRTGGDDVAQALALMGVCPVWGEESGRVTGLQVIPKSELGRPRIDVTLRVSGFFRDAFPHVIGLIDEAIETVAALDEPDSVNFVRAHGTTDPRVFGPKPGAYGSGILAVLESGDWRGDDDLADVYLAWGGYSYGRQAMGLPAPDAMKRRLSGVEIVLKNQDNREHDIFDSDDYLQDHGGMVATVRSLTGRQPLAWFGDSADPLRARVRSLSEEAARVVRSRVVNPKWIQAMMRHGYKGCFELAATVDYLFGYDATANVIEDWMYERVTEAYAGDPEVRKFFQESNPWALRSIGERLLEANERGLWNASDAALAILRSALLEAEGWEEGR